jgi:hypothetical protein
MGDNILSRIWIDADIAHYESVNGSWQLPVSKIRVMETTQMIMGRVLPQKCFVLVREAD